MRSLLTAACLILTFVAPARGATHLILPDGSGDFPTIQAALDAAAEGDEILLADGTYTGAGNRDLDFGGKALTVRSQSGVPAQCVIDCQGSAAAHHRGFWFHSGEDSTSLVADLTVRHGYAEVGGGVWVGGNLAIPVHAPKLLKCTIDSSYAELTGGGLHCGEPEYGGATVGNPILVSCRIIENEAGQQGGGVFCHEVSSPEMRSCRIANNRAQRGGGLGFYWLCKGRFYNCEIEDNHAAWLGGGAYVPWEHFNRFVNCRFLRNRAIQGGAFQNLEGFSRDRPGPAMEGDRYADVLVGCLFEGNSAENGGAIYASGGCRLQFLDCMFSHNTAVNRGGAICATQCNNLVIENSVFWQNSAVHGGAMFDDYDDAPGLDYGLEMAGCTLIDNEAARGAGLYLQEVCGENLVNIRTTIIAYNAAGQGIFLDPLSRVKLDCVDIYGNAGGDWTPDILPQVDLRGNFSADPCFCDREGGDFRLAADSWCLPGLHPWGCDELVGAFGQGCEASGCEDPVRTRRRSLGGVKGLYR